MQFVLLCVTYRGSMRLNDTFVYLVQSSRTQLILSPCHLLLSQHDSTCITKSIVLWTKHTHAYSIDLSLTSSSLLILLIRCSLLIHLNLGLKLLLLQGKCGCLLLISIGLLSVRFSTRERLVHSSELETFLGFLLGCLRTNSHEVYWPIDQSELGFICGLLLDTTSHIAQVLVTTGIHQILLLLLLLLLQQQVLLQILLDKGLVMMGKVLSL